MASREIHELFTHGSALLGPPDSLPDNTVRFLRNARLDVQRGTIASRPGMSKQSTGEITQPATMLHKRFDTNGDTTYQQSITALYRRSATWGGATNLGATGAATLSAVNMVDGKNHVWAHFLSGITRQKDDGGSYLAWGIAAPANPPTAVALASDLVTTIDTMNSAASWTGSGLAAGPSNEANITQGGGSVTCTIAANTIGSIGQGGLALNLDTLTGGDVTVKEDDYIHLWLRCDRPDRVIYIQMDFDLDTNVLANAFRTNYYSVRLQALSWLNQGRDQWTQLQVRKSEFQRFGSNLAVSWASVLAVRFTMMTSGDGAVQFYADDWKLRGGVDIEGRIEYAQAYRNSYTGGRGNPALRSDGTVRYTTPIITNRQRVTITTTNVAQTGADHPGDGQIDLMVFYRRIDGGNSVKIAEVSDAALDYTDNISVAGSALNQVLEDTPDSPGSEAENDIPPLGDVVFGPGALNRLFMLQGKNRCYVSKVWEQNEHRAENWPPLNFFLVGDGSQKALTGIVSDTTILIWTNAETYQVFGSSADTFLPVPIPNSRGIVGRNAADDGDGRIFFFAPDGLYEQIGNQQTLVVDLGETLKNPDINMNTSAAALASIWVRWHADINIPYVCILVPVGAATIPTYRIVVKKNGETGRYTDVILDTTPAITITCLLTDDAGNALYGGGNTGEVYKLEDHTIFTDAGIPVGFGVRSKAYHQGAPYLSKQYSEIAVEANTGGHNLSIVTLHNKEASVGTVGAMNTANSTGVGRMTPISPLTMYQDISISLSASVTGLLTIYRWGWYHEIQPEAVGFWDSGVISFPVIEALKRFNLVIDAPTIVTLRPYYDGIAGTPLTVLPTSGREYRQIWCPPNVKPRWLRVTLEGYSFFRLYMMAVRDKVLGSVMGYDEQSLMRRSG